jgi:hypothetical protein
MPEDSGSKIIEGWPEESKEAAKLVIEEYGEPHEATESLLIWYDVGAWKRMLASKEFIRTSFLYRTTILLSR